jgi:hypothetical protein
MQPLLRAQGVANGSRPWPSFNISMTWVEQTSLGILDDRLVEFL